MRRYTLFLVLLVFLAACSNERPVIVEGASSVDSSPVVSDERYGDSGTPDTVPMPATTTTTTAKAAPTTTSTVAPTQVSTTTTTTPPDFSAEGSEDLQAQATNDDQVTPGVNTDQPVLPEDLVVLLLDDADLNDTWAVGPVRDYRPDPSTESELERCPAIAAFDAIDAVLRVERDTDGSANRDEPSRPLLFTQILGRSSTAESASRMVVDFVAVEECLRQDFEEATAVTEFDDDEPVPEFELSIETTSIAHADAATQLTAAVEGEHLILYAIAVDDLVSIIFFEDGFLEGGFSAQEIAEVAAAKLTAEG